jgi:hypothetical protein
MKKKIFKNIYFASLLVLVIILLANQVVAPYNCNPGCLGEATCCDSSCVDTDTDRLHCGDCFTECNAGYICEEGECEEDPPDTYCGDDKIQKPNTDGIYEQCDGSNLANKGCADLSVDEVDGNHYFDGILKCYPKTHLNRCTFNTSMCNACGNNHVDAGEECDGEDLNSISCKDLSISYNEGNYFEGKYFDGTLSCYANNKCIFDISECVTCGNNYINAGEECDAGIIGNSTCYNISSPNACQNKTCGDGICNSDNNEDNITCFHDCFKDGWTTENTTGWSYNGVLHANQSGLKLISTYTIDLKANTSYTLSYNLLKNPSCIIRFNFSDGYCTSADGFINKKCFTHSTTMTLGTDGHPRTNEIKILSNPNAINGEYFKDVTLSINTITDCTNVSIANLSLVESTSPNAIYYDSEIPPETLSTGCCPNNYCWDGEVCQDSSQWMLNASLPGVWNLMNISEWVDNHVDTSSQFKGVSYRCVIVNNDTNEAQWVASKIKYDWNYEASGYCANENDCFVNENYNQGVSNYSRGCIHHGDVVSDDPYTFGEGNHYCYRGNWTTKSYIVALFLQNISTDKDYSLHCYDDPFITYNLPVDSISASNILSSCVLIQKGASDRIITGSDRIITGIVFKDSSTVTAFLDQLVYDYNGLYPTSPIDYPKYTCLSDPADTCISKPSDNNPRAGGLYVYYNTSYDYMLISDKEIGDLTVHTVWDKISGWFRSIFSNSDVISIPYTSINYTTSYDRIYVLRNTTLNVTALEEAKYDEDEDTIATLFYVKYVGSNPDNNPLYNDTIYKTIEDMRLQNGQVDFVIGVSVSNNSNPLEQELIIKSKGRTGLWQYFTSVLRTR